MNAREFLIHRCGGNPAMVDKFAAEVRREDAARLLAERADHINRAIFCDGITHAARRLTEWAGESTTQTRPDLDALLQAVLAGDRSAGAPYLAARDAIARQNTQPDTTPKETP